jgi:hypothetical protein
MTLRHISPRSVEWLEAAQPEADELTAEEALALRTMKALEEVEIRIALARHPRPERRLEANQRLSYRFPNYQLPHA